MLKAILFALTLAVVVSADSYFGTSQLNTYRKIIKEQSRQIDELLEMNQQLLTKLKACDTPRLASSSSDSDYSSKKTFQSGRSIYKSEQSRDYGDYKDSRDYRDSRDYSRDYARDTRDYNRGPSSRDNRVRTNGGLGIDPLLAEQLFASAMMPMFRPSPQPQPIFNMPQMFPTSSFSGPSYRPAAKRKEEPAKEIVPIAIEPPMPAPISCNQVQELDEEKTTEDQSGQEIKIKFESSTCSCEAERHCRFSYSSFNPETCVRQELDEQQTLTNCDLLTECVDDEQCDGILHDNGKAYKLTCSGDNTVSTVLADPHQFVIQIKNCL